MHVFGGQQLSWPPTKPVEEVKDDENVSMKSSDQVEESKEEKKEFNSKDAKEDLFNYELGFTQIIKAMIEAKKPIVGHNCMYDCLYIYNQFIDKLPDNYEEYLCKWNSLFPRTFDTKVLAFNSKSFFKTSLGEVYEKCTKDAKFMHNIKCKFDTKNGFVNYDGTELLSHYHEAAYDSHMTAVAFMHILKYKELEFVKNQNKTNKKGGKQQKGKDEKPQAKEKDVKNQAINVKGHYANAWCNQLMMDQFGSGRYYHYDPFKYKEDFENRQNDSYFDATAHLTFADDFIENLPAGTISSMFEKYGDFYLFKDTKNSAFLEFFYIDKKSVPDGKLSTFCEIVKKTPELKVIEAVQHAGAPKFKAHSNFDGN